MTLAAPVPLDGGPWRLSMGLRRLNLDHWLVVDTRREAELAYKAELLDRERDEVLGVLEGTLPATAELLGLVVDALAAIDGVAPEPDPALEPLEAASLLVQEDLCILERSEGVWRLTAMCVCFPSRWRPRDKLGRSLAGIHAPVPGFEEELSRPTSTFFDRLSAQRPVWRCNWTVLDTPELHLPSAAGRRDRSAAADPAGLHFRVERQTLRRLPASGAIVFTIRTYVTALAELVAADPPAARALRATLRTVPVDVVAYKGWGELLGPTIEWLGEVAPGHAGELG